MTARAPLTTALLLSVALCAPPLAAQDDAATPGDFDSASRSVQQQLQESLTELDALYERLAAEKLPLARELSELETELSAVRGEFQTTTRALDRASLDLTNLRNEIKAREDESDYLGNLLGEYIRNFDSTLHIVERQRYAEPLEAAMLAPENTALSDLEVFAAQAALLDVSLERLEDSVGGASFDGRAVDSQGHVSDGRYVLLGPVAVFRASDGHEVGTAEQRLGGSLEPTLFPFDDPLHAAAAEELILTGAGVLPLDPTLGNARKVAATETTLLEEVQKGGAVMIPIAGLAGLALLVALGKWLSLAFVRRPSKRKLAGLLAAVEEHDLPQAEERVRTIGGPAGTMLAAGVAHLDQPRELIEEVLFEKVLTTRLKLERWLPFIAITAASAPLLGLLGTVTGIINTFKQITVYGSGDVKALSGGISEALITTKFGLVVAIPALLLHAFLSRKARGVINQMETTAVTFVNQVARSNTDARPAPAAPPAPDVAPTPQDAPAASSHDTPADAPPGAAALDPELVRRQVQRALEELMLEQSASAS